MDMELNIWQKEMVKKYGLVEGDIVILKRGSYDTKNYMCKCGQYELFGFIDKLGMECRDCYSETNRAKINKVVEDVKNTTESIGVGYKTLQELSDATGKGIATIKRWNGIKVIKKDGLYYLEE